MTMRNCTVCNARHTEKTKLCPKCKAYGRNKQRERRRTRKARHADIIAAGLCSLCHKDTRTDGFKTCPTCRTQGKMKARALKEEVRAAYGGRCICCGETDSRFLTMDHVNNNGAEHRRQMRGGRGCGSHLYSWLKRKGFPKGFRVLCWNCNSGRAVNGGKCPHTDPEPDMILAAAGVV